MGQNKRQQVQTPQTRVDAPLPMFILWGPWTYFSCLPNGSELVSKMAVTHSKKTSGWHWNCVTALCTNSFRTKEVKYLRCQLIQNSKRLCKSSHERHCKLAETCNLQCTLEQWKKIKKSVTRRNLYSWVCWKTGRLGGLGRPCPSEDAHVSLPCTFCRLLKYLVLKPSL